MRIHNCICRDVWILNNVVILVILCLALSGCSRSGEKKILDSYSKEKPTVLIIGIDGVEPRLFNKYIKSGALPNLKKIVKNGSETVITTESKLASPVIWTTMATGVSPNIHGVTDFTLEGKPVNSSTRKVPAFWDILHKYKVKVATLGWWATWPALKDAGIVIGSRVYWQERKNKVWPPNIIDTEKYAFNNYYAGNNGITERFTSFSYEPDFRDRYKKGTKDYILNDLIWERLIKVYYRDKIYTDIALEIAQREKPQVMAVYFKGIDYVSHAFWQYFEPGAFQEAGVDVDHKDVQNFQKIIPEYYRYIDDLVGRLLTQVGDNTYVFLLSDHGFGPDPQLLVDTPALGLSGNHLNKTIFVLSGPEIVKQPFLSLSKRQRQVDFLPTLLYLQGVPVAQELEGQPQLEYFSPAFRRANAVKFVSHYAMAEKKAFSIVGGQEKKVLKDLKGLGYIK